MNDLLFLERLLDGAKVEWLPLESVTLSTCNIKWHETERAYRYIDLTSVDIKTNTISATKEITAENAPSRAQKIVETDDLIFATTRPAQQRYCLIDAKYAGEIASTGYCVLRAEQSKIIPKWLLHWISSANFKEYVEENQSGSAYPAISDRKVKAFAIPIPCPEDPEKSLAIQAEIVRILDAFTELTLELTLELIARKKQYNHYREQLLSIESGDLRWKPLGEAAENLDSKRKPITSNQREPGEIPYYGASGIVDYVRDYIFDGDFLACVGGWRKFTRKKHTNRI